MKIYVGNYENARISCEIKLCGDFFNLKINNKLKMLKINILSNMLSLYEI